MPERLNKEQLLKRGEEFFSSGDLGKARICFEKSLALDAGNVEALSDLGVTCFRMGDTEEAIHFFKRALEHDPTHSGALENLATCLIAEKEYLPATEIFEKILRNGNPGPNILNAMARCFMGLGDQAGAKRVLIESLKQDETQSGVKELISKIDSVSFPCGKGDSPIFASGRMQNIGFVSVWFERGQSYVTRTIRDILSKEHNTFVLARTGSVYQEPQLETKGFWDVPNLTTYPKYKIPSEFLIRWIGENHLDAILFNEEYDWTLVTTAVASGIKVLTYLDYFKPTWKPFLRLFDGVLCSTLRTYHLVRDVCRAHFIAWPVDTDLFKPRPDGTETYTFFHNAGWLGVNFRKNTPAVIQAFDLLSRDMKDITLLIHAQVGLEKLPPEIANLVQNNPRITYEIKTVPAPGLYHKGRILLFPSKLEGLGLPLLEGMSCGMPVIATDAAPMNEFVRHEENGLLVKVAETVDREDNIVFPETLVDVNDLVEKMARLASDHDRTNQMARNARGFVLGHASEEVNGWRISDVFSKTIQAKKHPTITAGVIAYNEEEFIEYALRSIYDFVDEIVIVWGPWECNVDTPRDSTRDIIRAFPDPAGKIKRVEGVFQTELEHRNTCLRHATSEYFFLVDGDEVYSKEVLDFIREEIVAHPEAYVFNIRSLIFWQDFDTIIDGDALFQRVFRNIPGCAFSWLNMLSYAGRTYKALGEYDFPRDNIFNFHFAYAKSDKAIRQKIEAYNSRKDCNTHRAVPNWYEEIWEGWKRSPEEVLRRYGGTHPVHPPDFSRFRKRTIALPEVFGDRAGQHSGFRPQGNPRRISPPTPLPKRKPNPLLDDLLKLLGNDSCRSMLDLGCGRVSRVSLDLEIPFKVGIDLFEDALSDASTHFPILKMDVRQLGFRDRSFDLALGMDVLEHLSKTDGYAFLSSIENLATRWVALYAPFSEASADGFLAQDDNPNWDATPEADKANILMQHLAGWKPEELEALGFRTHIYHHRLGRNKSTFWAVKKIGDFNSEAVQPVLDTSPFEHDHKENGRPVSPGSPNRLVSIVIPTITRAYLEECIASIEFYTSSIPYEIIIVNDGSRETSFLQYLSETPHRAIQLEENRGFAAASNAGFRAAQGDYIMTLNGDTLVRPGWLDGMMETLESKAEAAAVGPTVLTMGTDEIQTAGCAWDDSNYRKFRSLLKGERAQEHPAIKEVYPVDALSGVCILFKRKVLFEVSLFDERFVNGWEDMDICLALLSRGHRLYHAPATIEHKGSYVRDKMKDYRELISRNHDRFVEKWKGMTVVDHGIVPRTLSEIADTRCGPNPSLRIHVVGAQESNYPWGYENRILSALGRMGHQVISTDYRKQRKDLARRIQLPADLVLVCKGEGIPPEVIRSAPCPTSLWYAEQIGTPERTDEAAEFRRRELRFNAYAFDFVFSHDASNLEVYRQMGCTNVEWLPTATVDQAVHRPLNLPKIHDLAFVGSLTPRRKRLLDALSEKVDVYISNVWNPEEMNRIFNQSRIILNIHLSDLPNTETRIAEVLGAGGFLLTEELSSPAYAADGEHLVSFRAGDIEDLFRKIRYFLGHEEERSRIAAQGHHHVLRHHTMEARLARWLKTSQASSRGNSPGPETETVERILARGEDLFGRRDLQGAATCFQKVLLVDPDNIDAINNLGVVAHQSGDFDKAATLFSRALTKRGDYVESIENMANCLESKGDYREAVIWLEKTRQIGGDRTEILNRIGNCHTQMDDIDQAIRAYSESLRLDNSQKEIKQLLEGLVSARTVLDYKTESHEEGNS